MLPADWRDVPRPVLDIELEDGWEGLKTLIGSLVRGQCAGLSCDDLFFRGHGSHEWPLMSSFDRQFGALSSVARRSLHDAMIAEFRNRPAVAALRPTGDLTEDEVITLLQHYGAPTRLLDWTASPYIAAFFAFSSVTVTADGTLPEYCVVFALNKSAGAWQSDSGVLLVEARPLENVRLLAQRGSFTRNRSPEGTLEEYCERYYQGPNRTELALLRLLIPRSDASIALRELDAMGVTSEELFPGVEGAARYALFRALDRTDKL